MSARLFTTVQKNAPGALFDNPNTVHLARYRDGRYVPDCGTRANDVIVEEQTPAVFVTCEKCVAKLRREGIRT